MLLGWILVMSVVTFGAMARDKYQSIVGRRRIPETTLYGLALIGGSPGLVAAMLTLRHKTSKPRFLVSAGAIGGSHLMALLWYWMG